MTMSVKNEKNELITTLILHVILRYSMISLLFHIYASKMKVDPLVEEEKKERKKQQLDHFQYAMST